MLDLYMFERLQEDAALLLRHVRAAVERVFSTKLPDLGELDAPFLSNGGPEIGGFGDQGQPVHKGNDASDEPGIHKDDHDQYLHMDGVWWISERVLRAALCCTDSPRWSS